MPDRVANLTVSHRGRPACHYCDQCQRGCHTASYFNSPSVTLPAAARTGRFTLVSDAVVSHLRCRFAVAVRKACTTSTGGTHRHREASARVVIAGRWRPGVHSHSAQFPLAAVFAGRGQFEDGVLGHYLMDHFTVEGGGGSMPGPALGLHASRLAVRAASSFRSTSSRGRPAEGSNPTSFGLPL